VGEETLAALQAAFPTLDVTAHQHAYGNILGVSWRANEQRYLVETPRESDYRQQAPSWWIHRFTAAIREKTQ
jgi:hypothetical protein